MEHSNKKYPSKEKYLSILPNFFVKVVFMD